ncbi:unnamed protein product [Allacma fusca]|uniref:procollagen-proline 4-dioxygenase n=1 Tax=Allacma fusca TaxID=39272 RepID=A0A8J2KI54_9HEXA|nr:unnamed protein product [Allacma fusca]
MFCRTVVDIQNDACMTNIEGEFPPPTLFRQPLYALSISHLRSLERFDSEIVEHLTHTFLTTENLPIGSEIRRLVQVYLSDYEESFGKINARDAVYNKEMTFSRHPICAYRLTRRVTFLLQDLLSHELTYWPLQKLFDSLRHYENTNTNFGSRFLETVHNFSQQGWPNIENLETWAEKILRLQYVYNLEVNQLADGWVSTVPSNCTLHSFHCYEIAWVAMTTDQFASAIEWLELAKERASVDQKSSVVFIEFSLRNAIKNHNFGFDDVIKMEQGPWFFNRLITFVPGDSKNATKLRDLQYKAFKGNKQKMYSRINYFGLCSGDHLQTEREKAMLFCWNEFKIHPSYVIGPVKMEFLSQHPDIIQMYDILSEEEMGSIISESDDRLEPASSTFVGYNTASFSHHISQTSYHRSLVNSHGSFSKGRDLERKLERLTGLVVQGAVSEDLATASYSAGGHLHPHFDNHKYSGKLDSEKSPMITATFYLNDVELGGATVYTSAGVAASPVKGSLTLWFNIFNDGSVDFDSYHGGCPVLIGEKIVGNVWTNYEYQFSGKCGLQPMEKYRFPVNNEYLPKRKK